MTTESTPAPTIDIGIPGLDRAELVGRGGFGSVYRCHQASLNRTVAVKVFPAQSSDDELEAFERECQAVGQLHWCPEIVTVFQTGATQRGEPYLVMEYAAGRSLLDRLREQGTVEPAEATAMALSIGRALQAAHGEGILHRDVKPGNILISRSGNYVLADFGIARLLAGSRSTKAGMTGTVAYSAPEILNGSAASARSDLFSLGATLFAALAGRSPYAAGDEDSVAALVTRALMGPPADVDSLPISPGLKEVLTSLLARDPAARFASATDLVTALEHLPVVEIAGRRSSSSAAHQIEAEPSSSPPGRSTLFANPTVRDVADESPVPNGIPWPTATDYVRALQETSVPIDGVPALASAVLARDAMGMPVSASGQNAVVFELEHGADAIALRCYTRAPLDGATRSRQTAEFAARSPHPAVPPTRWISEGPTVDGRRWPALLMPWVPGRPLNFAVEDLLGRSDELRRLAQAWLVLLDDLQDMGVAHGDLQCGNVLVDVHGAIRLVDLDAFYVPGMTVLPRELGHPNFQHPERAAEHWGPDIDAFSGLVIYLSLLALAEDPDLWVHHNGENLVLCSTDFTGSFDTPLWGRFSESRDPQVRELTALLLDCLRAPHPPQAEFVLRQLGGRVREPQDGSRPDSATRSWSDRATPHHQCPSTEGTREWNTAQGMARTQTVPDQRGAHHHDGDDEVSNATVMRSQPHTQPQPRTQESAAPTQVGAWWDGLDVDAVDIPIVRLAAPEPVSEGRRGIRGLASNTLVSGVLAGTLAGLLGCELYRLLARDVFAPELRGAFFVALIGSLLTATMASFSSVVIAAWSRAFRLFAIGLAAGAAATLTGLGIFQVVLQADQVTGPAAPAWFAIGVWLVAGLATGIAIGLTRTARRLLLRGGIGGLLGGLLGGLVFFSSDPQLTLNRTGPKSQQWLLYLDFGQAKTFVAVTAACATLGLIIGLTERLTRRTWLTVMEGALRGVEINIDQRKASIGTATSCALRLPADQALLAEHAQILVGTNGYGLLPVGPVELNGAPVSPTSPVNLTSGDVIRIGGNFIRFGSAVK